MFLALLYLALLQAPATPRLPSEANASLRGHVYNRLTGEAVPGATLWLRDLKGKESLTTITDSQGAFVFSALHPGPSGMRYIIQCTKDGFARPDEVWPVLAEGQDKTGIDFRIWPGAVITGAVTDADDRPLSGVAVQAIRKVYFGVSLILDFPLAAETDRQGHFRITNLPPGRYYVKADMGARNTESRGYPAVFFPGAAQWTDAQAVPIAAGEEYGGFHFKLPDAATFKVRGKVIDSQTNRPVAGIKVGLWTECHILLPTEQTVSSADGTFHFAGLLPGRYWSKVTGPGSGPLAQSLVPFEIRDTDVKDLLVELGAKDKPATETNVALFSTDERKRSKVRYFRSAQADSSGAFRILGVIPGDYLLLPWPADPGEALDPEIFPQIEKYATAVSVTRSGIVTADLRLTREIRAVAGVP
jgi:hypothetical protein